MNLGSWINSQVLMSAARWAINSGAVALAAKGYLSHDEAAQVAAVALSAVTLIAGIVSARTKHVALVVAGHGSAELGHVAVQAAKKNGA